MYILIDDAVNAFHFHHTSAAGHEPRHYYVSTPPYLAIIICHSGLVLPALQDRVVYAFLSYDFGTTGLCVLGYEGQRHRKITIQRVLNQVLPQRTLTHVLRTSYG